MISRSKYPTSRQLIMAREETEVGSLLPPSGGWKQAGTTSRVVFRARLGTGGERQGAGDASFPGSMMYVKGLVPEDRRR
jgi:hypothetical protein